MFLWYAAILQADVNTNGEGISINGFVREQSTGEPIPYANVYLAELNVGTSTNDDGYFLIQSVPFGKYQLRVVMMAMMNMLTH